jgi:hypothetical protein
MLVTARFLVGTEWSDAGLLRDRVEAVVLAYESGLVTPGRASE